MRCVLKYLNMMRERLKALVRVEFVPPELEERVRQTAAKCDTEAITIEE